MVVLDEWVLGIAPGVTSRSLSAYCASVMAATPPWRRGRWMMDLECYNGLLAEHGPPGSPAALPPSCDAMLFGIPVMVAAGGGLPHLEAL